MRWVGRQQRNSKSPAQRHPWDEERPWEFRESVAPSGGALTANALASARRRSISAESIIPSQLEHLIYKNIPKNEGQRERIRTTISTIFLFKSLEEKQINQIIDAMEEVRLPAGMKVLVEGDDADRYYVVESGTLEAWRSERDSDDRKVETYGPGTSFGELALMYQTKRAATVLVTSDCVLWVIDRQTFQQILSRRSMDTRRKYETFLEDVEILRNLTHYERTRLTEALETRHYRAGEIVIRQGEPGDLFFIIEHGTADISRVNRHGNVTQLAEIGIGKYFGGTSRGFEMIEPILERALLYGEPRSATVKAKTDLTVIVFSKDAFQRLLGPIHDVLKRFTFEPSPSIVSRYTLTKRSSKGGDESPVLAVGATALSRKRSSSQSPKPRSVHKK